MATSNAQRRPDRRRELVRAAYQQIADQGFEGLRTRDVAARVGVNVATLHYYFPTKESLIRAVLGHAMQRFTTTLSGEGTAAEQLRHHLRGVQRLYREEPALFAVMGELALRSARDPTIAGIFGDTGDAWHQRLRALVAQGLRERGLDAGLDPDEAAALIVAALKGMCMVPGTRSQRERVDQAIRQLERWLGLTAGDGGPQDAGTMRNTG